jgi:hypothetical protein
MNDLMTIEMSPMQVAEVFTKSGMFPDAKSVSVAATKLIVGRGMGLNDFDSMSGLSIIQGNVTLRSNLMAAAIKRSGKYDYESVSTDECCTITFFDVTGNDRRRIGEKTWTMETAKRAGLNGQAWRKYPEAMLFARCISAGYREHCPDALGAAPVYVQAHGESEIPDPKRVENEARSLPAPVPPTPAAEWVKRKVETVEEIEMDERLYLKLWGVQGDEEFILAVDNESLFDTVRECVGINCEYQLQKTANSPRVLDVRHINNEGDDDAD